MRDEDSVDAECQRCTDLITEGGLRNRKSKQIWQNNAQGNHNLRDEVSSLPHSTLHLAHLYSKIYDEKLPD